MKKSNIFICKEIWSVLFITWLFLGMYLVQEDGITGHLTYTPATGGQTTRVDIGQEQFLWYGFFGTISDTTNANNTLVVNYTSTTPQTIRHNIGFEDFCTYGKLIVSTSPNFAPTGLRSISHFDHDTYLTNTRYPINSANMFTMSRQYNIDTYTLNLYSLELNGDLGYFFQGFGKFGADEVFYISPTVNHGIGYKGQQANYQILLPRLQNDMTYYFSYDNTDCIGTENLTQPIQEDLTIQLSVQLPSRVCVDTRVQVLVVDLNQRIYCYDREDIISQGQCREIADAEIEIYHEDDITNSIISLTTDDEGIAHFTPNKVGYYTFKIASETHTGTKKTYVGDCSEQDTLYIKGGAGEYKPIYENGTQNTSEQASYYESPAYMGPHKENYTPSFILTTLSFTWALLTIPVLLGLCLLYYWHYKDSAIWLLKLRIYIAQAKADAKMRVKEE